MKKQNIIPFLVAGLGVAIVALAATCTNSFPTSLNNYVTGNCIPSSWANALEAKIGIDNSAVTTSLDYLLKNPASLNPGHIHSTSSIIGVFTPANGGTGVTSFTNGLLYASGTANFSSVTANDNGQIPISSGTTWVAKSITAGTNISITTSSGGITLNSTVTAGGTVFSYTGATSSWTVPDGVSFIRVTLLGARGGRGSGSGGKGGYLTGMLRVTSGTVYYYCVGGSGQDFSNSVGGFCGGGNAPQGRSGGGASWFGTSGNPASSTLLLVAAGGGGDGNDGGVGGDGGLGAGTKGNDGTGTAKGTGGQITGGGAGGGGGAAGSFLQGGVGGNSRGGGGGGGYNGGGGGGDNGSTGDGGGGGASFASSTIFYASSTLAGTNNATGSIIIQYNAF